MKRPSRPRAWLAVAALAVIVAAVLVAANAKCGQLWRPACTGAQLPAPDPGGNPHAQVPVPPGAGRVLGFASDLAGTHPDDPAMADRESAAIAAMGATMQRIPVQWSFAEKVSPDRAGRHYYDAGFMAGLDRRMAALRRHGLRALLQVASAPQWATYYHNCLARDLNGQSLCAMYAAVDEPHLRDYRDFVAYLARRYRAQRPAFEIWNEPNLKVFYRPVPDPAFYARVVKAGYDGARSVDPHALVLAGSVNDNEVFGNCLGSRCDLPLKTFLEGMYDAGWQRMAPHAQLSIHAYPFASFGADSHWARTFRDVRAVLREHHDTHRPVWVTELGADTSGGTPEQDPAEQRRTLREAYRRLMTMHRSTAGGPAPVDVRGLFLFTLKEDPTLGPASPFGLLRDFGHPKPAFCWFAGDARRGADAARRAYPGC